MKQFTFAIALIISTITTLSFAQDKPQAVHSIVKVYQTYDWYSNQYKLWEEETTQHPTDENAWLNRYAASRMAKITAKSDGEREKWVSIMKTVITGMAKSIPETYTYYHIMAWDVDIWKVKTHAKQDETVSYAQKAYKLQPNNPAIYPDLMNYYLLRNDQSKLKNISQKWRNSNDISANIFAINYNMLMSTKPNAILITAGDNDTYPALVLQHSQGIRTDVSVMNIYLASFSAEYRNHIFKAVGIPLLNGDDLSQETVIDHIIKQKQKTPLYFAFGNYFSENPDLKENLYNVGMAMEYCNVNINNTSTLIHNFEQKYLLDQLTFPLYLDPFPEQIKRHNFAYLPGLMILYEHYKITENTVKLQITKNRILNIIVDTSYEESIKSKL